jgi:hypothetical protein
VLGSSIRHRRQSCGAPHDRPGRRPLRARRDPG